MGLTPRQVANALKEGVGIAMDKDGDWFAYDEEPEYIYAEDEGFATGFICAIGEGIKIDYSGDWKDSWTPKLLQGEQDALDMIEGEKALLKQEQETEQKYCYKRENGYVCNKPLPCPVHAEKKDK